ADNRLPARCRRKRIDRLLQQVLIQSTGSIEQARRGLEPMDQRAALRMRQPLVIDSFQPPHDAEMPCLRQKRVVVDEAPHREESVDTAGLTVVANNSVDAHHGAISTSKRSCLPGSYRRRA